MLWGISFASLNLGSLAYAVADRANAGKRVGASRGMIGIIQAMLLHRRRVAGAADRPAHVFLVLGGLTLLAVVAALMLPPLPQRADRAARLPACPSRIGSRSGASCWASPATACSC